LKQPSIYNKTSPMNKPYKINNKF